MATTVTYKNDTLTSVNNTTKTLKTAGKYLEDDITLIDVTESTPRPSVYQDEDGYLVLDDEGENSNVAGTFIHTVEQLPNGGEHYIVTGVDISSTTAVASDVISGKYFYTADGTRTQGTASNNRTIASGTYTGTGTFTCTVPVGKKMPKTNFLFHMYAPGGTEYSNNGTYKYSELTCVIPDTIASYDLSSDGNKAPIYTGNITWSVNTDGTITNVTNYSTGYMEYVRNASTAGGLQGQSGRPTIIRSATGFSIYYSQGNSNYQFVNGLSYNWNLYYFGSNPSTDIVEIE